jgi:hypothetical protein
MRSPPLPPKGDPREERGGRDRGLALQIWRSAGKSVRRSGLVGQRADSCVVEAISPPLDCRDTIDLPRKCNRSKSHRSGERYRNDLKSARQGSPIQLFCGSACGMLRQSVADPRTSDPEECGEGGEWYFRKRCIVDGCRCSTRRGSDLAKGTTAGFRRIPTMARESRS